jgi:serine phosphatase RsbU (regulator of sigma subunit)/FixJ family two-component response regulator
MSRGDAKLKLMVVDDEPDNLDLLYRTFRREYKVFKADSAFAALEILDTEGEMALIISDQRMPEMNGTEFLGRTLEKYPDTVRILLTGYTDVEDLVEAINSGKVFKYITKPWNPEELKRVIKQAEDTYRVVKHRTNALTRALQRESLFNEIMRGVRESLDYSSMLATIVNTLGHALDADCCKLWPVEGDRLSKSPLAYPSQETVLPIEEELIQTAISTCQTQIVEENSETFKLVFPLTYQQDLLAILALYQDKKPQPWSHEEIALIESVAQQASLAISQAKLYQRATEMAEQMRNELEVARQIQSNLLRQSWPILDSVRIQACCHPAREVGGDFFEVYVHAQGDIWVAVGDVSGKGVPAALFMASAMTVMRRELGQENPPEPEQVIMNLNASLSDDLIGNNCFITMVLARYTPSTGILAYTNAGHIYPLVWSQTALGKYKAGENTVEPNFLKARGIPLGILPVWRGQAGTIKLESGDVLLLTSDGITEATVMQPSTNGEMTRTMLQQEGLWQFLLQQQHLDLNNLLTRIRADNEIQEDDQTILSLEVL